MKTCPQCGRDIINRHAKAIYCSDKCRTAACRKRTVPLVARKVQRLEAEVQRLRTRVKLLQNENCRLNQHGESETVAAVDGRPGRDCLSPE